MKLCVIFGLRHQRYDGEHAPEVLDCWDEFVFDENPEGFEASLARHQVNVGTGKDFAVVSRIDITVDGGHICDLLSKVPVVRGVVTL